MTIGEYALTSWWAGDSAARAAGAMSHNAADAANSAANMRDRRFTASRSDETRRVEPTRRAARPTSPPRLGADQLRLHPRELLVGDRALLLQVVELVDRCGPRGLADVALEMPPDLGLLLDGAVPHAVSAHDQVDEGGQERDEDQEEDPDRLRPSRQLVVPEEVADDREEHHDPGDEEEDPDDGDEGITEGVVGQQHSRLLAFGTEAGPSPRPSHNVRGDAVLCRIDRVPLRGPGRDRRAAGRPATTAARPDAQPVVGACATGVDRGRDRAHCAVRELGR